MKAADVFELLYHQFGIEPGAQCKGPGSSTLYFMAYGKRHLILQVWAGGGWDIYASPTSIKIDETLEWLKSLN